MTVGSVLKPPRLPVGSPEAGFLLNYLLCLTVLGFARGADMLSTWIVTPDLRLERNQTMRRLGWSGILLFNLAATFCGALSPDITLAFSVASLLFASTNILFQPGGRYGWFPQILLASFACALLSLLVFRIPGSSFWDWILGLAAYLLTTFIWSSKQRA